MSSLKRRSAPDARGAALAQVAAHRRILKALIAREQPDAGLTDPRDEGATWALREAVRALASIYADRPGFRAEWAS